jgi:sensor domain CHASE-containing protein
MSHPIAGRITLNLVAGILLTIVTVVAAITWMAHRQNDQAANATRTMVSGGIDAMHGRVQDLANDYAWWEEAYDAYQRGDDGWISANIGTGIIDTQIADFLAILTPEGELKYGWSTAETAPPAAELLTPDVVARVKELIRTAPVENSAARSTYLLTPKSTLLIAVSRLAPVSRAETTDPATLPLLLMGLAMTPERLSALGESFLIEDLTLVEGDPPGYAAFPEIRDIFGKVINRLAWTPPTPGSAVLRNVLPPIGVALLLFAAIAMWTALRARRLAVSQAESERHAIVAARTDSLTGLTNRFGFNEFTEGPAYAEACRRGEAAIVYLDVNGFKAVNDSIGHQGGDELVKRLGERLTMVMPPDATFARVGGDEFAAALTGRAAS